MVDKKVTCERIYLASILLVKMNTFVNFYCKYEEVGGVA